MTSVNHNNAAIHQHLVVFHHYCSGSPTTKMRKEL